MTYTLIGLLVGSIFFLGSYYFAINSLYKKENKRNISVMNTFLFEAAPQYKTEKFFINVLLFISLIATLTGTILFTVSYFDVMPLVTSIASLFALACLGFIPFVHIKFLKEHLTLAVGIVAAFFATSGLLTFLSYSICKLYDYQNVTAIISIVISGVLFLISFILIMNPRLFDLRNEVKDDVMVRPKRIPLVISEWLVLLASPLILVPLILLSSIL